MDDMKIMGLVTYCNKYNTTINNVKKLYKEWLIFHETHRITSNDICDICDFNKDDKHSNNLLFIVEESTYCVISNSILTGLFLCDIRCNTVDELILSKDCDWYNCIRYIINFVKDDNMCFSLSPLSVMAQHPVFDEIITKLGGIITKHTINAEEPVSHLKWRTRNIYFIQKNKYNITSNNYIQVIGYSDYDKQKTIFNHKSQVHIISTIEKAISATDDIFMRHLDRRHITKKYELILETPLIYKTSDRIDTYIDLFITHNNNVDSLHTNNNFDLRINKLAYKGNSLYISNNNPSHTDRYKCIYSLVTYKYGCECNRCMAELAECKTPNDFTNHYYNTMSNKILYEFLYNKSTNNGLISRSRPKIKNIVPNHQKGYYNFANIDVINISYLFEHKDDIQNNSVLCSYIYLIELYDVNKKIAVYKFGKSKRPIMDRMKEHCMTSKILLVIDVNNCDITEKNILKVLVNDKYMVHRKDLGREYFCCDSKKYIMDVVMAHIK